MTNSASDLTPAGTQTYSKHPSRFPQGCPDLAVSGDGCRIHGSDGRTYVDFVSALGAVILGYRDSDVDTAVIEQLRNGVSFSLPTHLEAQVAKQVCALVPGAEMVRFQKNGADACDTAVRLARAVTGRERIVNVGYHGKSDAFVADTNPRGVPDSSRDLMTRVPYGDLAAIEAHLDRRLPGSRAACLIMEPVVATNPVLPPPGYLEGCRALCDQYGALLIFDEVVTGFRMALGGAQEAFGVRADLIAAGKAMANGFPLSIVCGPRKYMELLDGRVFCSTTFGGETISLAAASATLGKLADQEVPAALGKLGERIMGEYGLAVELAGLAPETRVIGYPQRPVIQWRREALRAAFGQAMLHAGYLFQGYMNLTWAHVNEPFLAERLADAFGTALAAAAGVLAEAPDLPIGAWK
ncbi:MAG: aminotransferase class III-fold pyridoxal phosphate-dependent enzyme [Elusimicrobia bacterium]|nr:aminotransferase class III-fold pyridoxal phosphate-dependent enzyme [Elusimicrobiota bacterium]